MTPAAERALARALRTADPAAALARAARSRRLDPATRRAFAAAHPDGVRLAALLVARLRFERLLRGSREAEEWFDRDAAGFGAAFRRYHAEVAPTAFFPPGEARLFSLWLARSGRPPPLLRSAGARSEGSRAAGADRDRRLRADRLRSGRR